MKKAEVLVYGDINIDLVVPGVSRLPQPGQEVLVGHMDTFVGGGAALFALGLGKLGVKTIFKGSVGNDLYGTFIRSKLEDIGLDTSLLAIEQGIGTGVSISFTNEKDRCFLSTLGTNSLIDFDMVTEEELTSAGHVHLTSYQGSSNHKKYATVLKKLKGMGATVSMDVGWDSTGEWYEGITELLPLLDVFFMNEEEAIHYTRCSHPEDAIAKFGALGNIVVGKLGSNGSIAYEKGQIYREEQFTVKAVDTTGAGDSFNAGFIYGFLRKASVRECLRFGNACGALSVTAFGGNTAFPDEVRLKEFLSAR